MTFRNLVLLPWAYVTIKYSFYFWFWCLSYESSSQKQPADCARHEMHRFFVRKCTFHLSSFCEVCSSPNGSKIWMYPEIRRLLTENRVLYIPSHPPALWFWGELAAGHQVHNLKFFRLCDEASEPATGLVLVTSPKDSLPYNSDYGWEIICKRA